LVKAAGTLDLKLVERANWQIAGEYVDHGISGAKGRGKRPEFDRLIKAPPGGSSTW
jgi:DNA invertase Pin-like site-specific DNA recombinase